MFFEYVYVWNIFLKWVPPTYTRTYLPPHPSKKVFSSIFFTSLPCKYMSAVYVTVSSNKLRGTFCYTNSSYRFDSSLEKVTHLEVNVATLTIWSNNWFSYKGVGVKIYQSWQIVCILCTLLLLLFSIHYSVYTISIN